MTGQVIDWGLVFNIALGILMARLMTESLDCLSYFVRGFLRGLSKRDEGE